MLPLVNASLLGLKPHLPRFDDVERLVNRTNKTKGDGKPLGLLSLEYENMLACVRCGQCLTSCPTYVLTGREAFGPRGRIALARALVEGHTTVSADLIASEESCLVCEACTAVCPAGVQMQSLQVRVREAIEPMVERSLSERLKRHIAFHYVLGHLTILRLVVWFLWVYQATGLQHALRKIGLLRVLGIADAESYLPRVSRRFVVPRGQVLPAETKTSASPKPTRVAFFAGCVMSTALASIDEATLRVLRRAGCEVSLTKGQVCCGALQSHNGDLKSFQVLAMQNVAAFERDGEGPIVVNSAGCGAMLKHYAHELAHDPEWAERAKVFSARIQDITEVLVDRELPMRRSLDLTATYQDPCHLAHAQRIRQQPRQLLKAVPGLKLREMADSTLCCGSAGIYNLTNPKEARQLQDRKLDNATVTGARVLVTANPGCLLHLRSGLARRRSDIEVKHIVEILDEASQ